MSDFDLHEALVEKCLNIKSVGLATPPLPYPFHDDFAERYEQFKKNIQIYHPAFQCGYCRCYYFGPISRECHRVMVMFVHFEMCHKTFECVAEVDVCRDCAFGSCFSDTDKFAKTVLVRSILGKYETISPFPHCPIQLMDSASGRVYELDKWFEKYSPFMKGIRRIQDKWLKYYYSPDGPYAKNVISKDFDTIIARG